MADPQPGYNPPRVIPLSGGLDLQAARFFVTPGTLRDCLNYETHGVSGYSVQEGLEPYDGTIPCFARDYVVIGATTWTGSTPLILGEEVYRVRGSVQRVFGRVIRGNVTPDFTPALLITDRDYYPTVGDTILGKESGYSTTVTHGLLRRASAFYKDMGTFLDKRESIHNEVLNEKQSIFPYVSYAKNITPHGAHWFRGRLYVAVNHYAVAFNTGASRVLPGDLIKFADDAQAIVLDIKTTTGSWSEGNVVGSLLVKFTQDTILNTTVIGTVDVIRPNGATATTTISDAINITDVQTTDSWGAGFYYGNYDDEVTSAVSTDITGDFLTTNRRWYPLEMGWSANFVTDVDCTGDAIPTIQRGSTSTEIYAATTSIQAVPTTQTLQAGYTTAAPLGPNSETNPSTTALSSVLGDNSDSTYVAYVASATVTAAVGTSGTASITGFDFSGIPDKAKIVGFEVLTRLARDASVVTLEEFSAVNLAMDGTKLNLLGASTSKTVKYVQATVSSIQEDLSGGQTDLWGFESTDNTLLLAAVKDPTFGVKFSLTDQLFNGFNPRAILYKCLVRVYYRPTVEKVYAHDPVSGTDLEVEIPYYNLEKGQLNPGADTSLYGSGSVVIYKITPLDTTGGAGSVNSNTQSILNGWQLRSSRDGGGVLLAKFSGDMVSQMLPTRQAMAEARKQFVIYNANYYAQDQYDAFYGTTGLSPSFQYDQNYFFFFRTELSKDEDTPSHTCQHLNHNILGYDTGIAIVSLPGEPTNYNSVLGATEYATGDRITNLLSIGGTMLGMFCESSIQGLAGTILTAVDANDTVQQIISPYSGAIDYTANVCGNTIIFADFRGIATLSATAQYGDFNNGKVSWKINPIIRTRVNDRFAFQAANQHIMFAKAIKNKNQVRFYCADGLNITCTLPSADRDYEFTKHQYTFSSNLDSLVPTCIATGVTKQGADVIFGAFRIVRDDVSNIAIPLEPERECFVYSIDSGTKFYLSPIKHFAQINFMTLDDPLSFDLIRNVRMEMLSYNYFNGYVKVAADYEDFKESKLALQINPDGLPIRVEEDSTYMVAKINGRGTTLALEFGGEHIYPGHILQALGVESMSGRTQQGASPVQTIK